MDFLSGREGRARGRHAKVSESAADKDRAEN
jgi:hypothetical protein